nr:MAG TPA: hypothetical protein [Caudoviricetes sp.]
MRFIGRYRWGYVDEPPNASNPHKYLPKIKNQENT